MKSTVTTVPTVSLIQPVGTLSQRTIKTR